jgi:hypothetical protein
MLEDAFTVFATIEDAFNAINAAVMTHGRVVVGPENGPFTIVEEKLNYHYRVSEILQGERRPVYQNGEMFWLKVDGRLMFFSGIVDAIRHLIKRSATLRRVVIWKVPGERTCELNHRASLGAMQEKLGGMVQPTGLWIGHNMHAKYLFRCGPYGDVHRLDSMDEVLNVVGPGTEVHYGNGKVLRILEHWSVMDICAAMADTIDSVFISNSESNESIGASMPNPTTETTSTTYNEIPASVLFANEAGQIVRPNRTTAGPAQSAPDATAAIDEPVEPVGVMVPGTISGPEAESAAGSPDWCAYQIIEGTTKRLVLMVGGRIVGGDVLGEEIVQRLLSANAESFEVEAIVGDGDVRVTDVMMWDGVDKRRCPFHERFAALQLMFQSEPDVIPLHAFSIPDKQRLVRMALREQWFGVGFRNSVASYIPGSRKMPLVKHCILPKSARVSD